MKSTRFFHLVAVASATLFLLVATGLAQVPQLINYQGRVAVGGTNFTGTGQFKFTLVNGTTPTVT